LTLERLVSDGRIHPGRIEEVVRKAEEELDNAIREAGQRAVLEVGVHGIHPELVKLVGMLKYRYSYAQNVLMHSIEAAFIAGARGSRATSSGSRTSSASATRSAGSRDPSPFRRGARSASSSTRAPCRTIRRPCWRARWRARSSRR